MERHSTLSHSTLGPVLKFPGTLRRSGQKTTKRKLRNCAKCGVRHGPPTGKNCKKFEEVFKQKSDEMERAGAATAGNAEVVTNDSSSDLSESEGGITGKTGMAFEGKIEEFSRSYEKTDNFEGKSQTLRNHREPVCQEAVTSLITDRGEQATRFQDQHPVW